MLRFLSFELQHEDADFSTLEAMASVKSADIPALEAEGRWLLQQLPAWLGTLPSPLDAGGEWDVWAQAHWNGQLPTTVDAQLPCWASATHPAPAWWTLTITLVVSNHLLAHLNTLLEP